MVATSMEELERQLMLKLKQTMNAASHEMQMDAYDEVRDFYSQGSPVVYQRTGALGDTPRATIPKVSGNEITFEVYLDQDYTYPITNTVVTSYDGKHHYTSRGSAPTMGQVLELANYGKPFTTKGGKLAHPTLGKKGFWEQAEKAMSKRLKSKIKENFK